MELPEKYQWVYEQFSVFEFHTVRKIDTFWGGLWSNLWIIDQILKR